MTPKHDKRTAGRLGGLATLQKHGRAHLVKIGKKGAAVTWTRYKLEPCDLTDFAMVDRQTGKIKALLSGRPF